MVGATHPLSLSLTLHPNLATTTTDPWSPHGDDRLLDMAPIAPSDSQTHLTNPSINASITHCALSTKTKELRDGWPNPVTNLAEKPTPLHSLPRLPPSLARDSPHPIRSRRATIAMRIPSHHSSEFVATLSPPRNIPSRFQHSPPFPSRRRCLPRTTASCLGICYFLGYFSFCLSLFGGESTGLRPRVTWILQVAHFRWLFSWAPGARYFWRGRGVGVGWFVCVRIPAWLIGVRLFWMNVLWMDLYGWMVCEMDVFCFRAWPLK